jgi:serine/threonine-protein kinase
VSDPLLGTEVAKYRLTRVLGAGGMGCVYLGVHPEIGSRVAIKVLAKEHAGSVQLVQRFFDEARAVNLIDHENIIDVLDLDRLPDGRPYIVMEYVKGDTLRGFLKRGPLPIAGLVRVATEVLRALDAVHAAGIIHRDLKPDNVMVTVTGHAKVLDFGIAKLTHGGEAMRTQTGVVLGTPHYMAPEQIRGAAVDARTDLYAFGVVLFEIATGVRPFSGDSDFELMEQHVREPPRDPRTLRPDLPVALSTIILTALEKSPAKRFQSARAMATAIAAVTPAGADAWLARASTSWRAEDVEPELAGTLPDAGESAAGPTIPDRRQPATVEARPSSRRAVRSSRSNAWLWAVLAVVVFAVAVTITYLVARRESSPGVAVVTPPPAPVMTPDAAVLVPPAPPPVDAALVVEPAPPVTKPAPAMPTLEIDYNQKRFDAGAYLSTALANARGVYPDARLTSFTLTGVWADGLMDLTEATSTATFAFQSATASASGQPCQLLLVIAKDLIVMSPTASPCGTFTAELNCTLAELHAQMVARGMYKSSTMTVALAPGLDAFMVSPTVASGAPGAANLPNNCN